MKVITEERFRYLFEGIKGFDYEGMIAAEFEELDTLTVTRLRPMSELMSINDYSYFVLAYKDSDQEFVCVRQSSNDEVFCGNTGKYHNINEFNGFTPMPRYEPEKV